MNSNCLKNILNKNPRSIEVATTAPTMAMLPSSVLTKIRNFLTGDFSAILGLGVQLSCRAFITAREFRFVVTK